MWLPEAMWASQSWESCQKRHGVGEDACKATCWARSRSLGCCLRILRQTWLRGSCHACGDARASGVLEAPLWAGCVPPCTASFLGVDNVD